MKERSYDSISKYYDRIKYLVFGDSLDKASSHFLSTIRPAKKVLILGGGTGLILEGFPEEADVVFLDISRGMIERAQKRMTKANVKFVCSNYLEEELPKFDTIICPFFLDNFSREDLNNVISKLKTDLLPGGKLIVTEFRDTKSLIWKAVLFIMHRFFRVTSGITSNRLSDIHEILVEKGFEEKENAFFRRRKIFSRIYTYLETL